MGTEKMANIFHKRKRKERIREDGQIIKEITKGITT